MNELYQILKVKPNATAEEIHCSFRKLAKETHPDLNANDDQKVKRFQEIKDAYDILSDPEKRARYDAAQVKPKVTHPTGSSVFDNTTQDYVLALINRLVRMRHRRFCDFFVGCVLTVLIGFVVWMRQTSELRHVLSLIRLSGPREALIILGILLGFALLVLLADTFVIIMIRFKLKNILKRKG